MHENGCSTHPRVLLSATNGGERPIWPSCQARAADYEQRYEPLVLRLLAAGSGGTLADADRPAALLASPLVDFIGVPPQPRRICNVGLVCRWRSARRTSPFRRRSQSPIQQRRRRLVSEPSRRGAVEGGRGLKSPCDALAHLRLNTPKARGQHAKVLKLVAVTIRAHP